MTYWNRVSGECVQEQAERVVVGMDPHKRSATIEVMNADEEILGRGRFGTDARPVLPRWWVTSTASSRIQNCGCGRSRGATGSVITSRSGCLLPASRSLDVPPKLSARARVFATGQGRKTDATDAHSVALVGTRMAGLRQVVDDQQLAVLRVLVDRRRSLGEDHTRIGVPGPRPVARADPRRGQAGPVRGPGQEAARHRPATRRGRQDPAPGRRRADR